MDQPPKPQPRELRPVYFTAETVIETPVYARADLYPGYCITGPAIIEQLDTTTPIYPEDRAETTTEGHLIITIATQTEN